MSAARRCLLVILPVLAQAAEVGEVWPQFRGPSGKAMASGPAPVEFGPQKNLLWKTPVPEAQSSASVYGDRIFTLGGDKTARRLETVAVDRKTGKVLWRRAVMADAIENLNLIGSPATATPAVDEERVYAYFGSYGLICYDHAGKELWTVRLPPPNKRQGSGTSPVLAGDVVLLNRDDPEEAYLLAVDKRTGKTVWKTEYGNPSKSPGTGNTSTPALWKDEIVIHRHNEILGLDAKTGARKWSVLVRSTGVATPAIADDAVYVPTWFNTGEPDIRSEWPNWADLLKGDKDGDGLLVPEEYPKTLELARRPESSVPGTTLALPAVGILGQADANKDGKLAKEEYDALRAKVTASIQDHGLIAVRTGASGDVTKSHVMWREARSVSEVPSPLFSNGRVYMVTNGGVVTCLDAQSGKLLYRGRLGAGGSYFSSPVAADGKIYFSSADGVVVAIKDADKLEVLAKNDLGEPIFATPAILGGILYTRTASHLYAFGGSAAAK